MKILIKSSLPSNKKSVFTELKEKLKSGSAIGASELDTQNKKAEKAWTVSLLFVLETYRSEIEVTCNLANNNDSGNPYLETPHHVNTNWRTLFIKYSQVLIPMSNLAYVLYIIYATRYHEWII